MLDQSFSTKNFEIIFTLLNRQGKVKTDAMSEYYQTVVEKIHAVNEEIKSLCKKKKSLRTEEETARLAELQESLPSLRKQKAEVLTADMEALADEVNGRAFAFNISKNDFDGKEEFMLDDSLAASYAMKQLQHNIKRTFKIEMTGRYQILSSIKRLLNMKMPIYIIRTDISSFFESIPQERLLKKILDNSLLSYKSKTFIKGVIDEYERIKDTTLVAPGIGVPRGVGISSMLSEIYMKDIDNRLRCRSEVIYYARYVDDIFMIMTSLGEYKTINDYYAALGDLFSEYRLSLKPKTDAKCQLVKFSPNERFTPVSFDYLGYKLNMNHGGKARDPLNAKYSLSDRKKAKIGERIDKAFSHFESLSKVDIKAARQDLLDSLNFISGNFRLSNAKHCAKVGLYYNNDLLDEISELDSYTATLHAHLINPHASSFRTVVERQTYIDALKTKIDRIDFKVRWENKTMYDFSVARIAEISSWL
jgi:hypothetical protein